MSFSLLDPLNCVYIIYIHIYIITCNSLNHYYFFASFIPIYCLRASFLSFFMIFFFSSITFPIFNLLLLSLSFFTLFFVSSNSFSRNSHTCFPFLAIFRSVTPFSSKFHFSSFIILQTFKSFSLSLLTNYLIIFIRLFRFFFGFPPFPFLSIFLHVFPIFTPSPSFLLVLLLLPSLLYSFQRFLFSLTSGCSFHPIRMQPVRNGTATSTIRGTAAAVH